MKIVQERIKLKELKEMTAKAAILIMAEIV